MINKTIITKNKNETQKLGKDLAKEIKKGVVLALYGELGSGKTTFVQGFAKGLRIKNRIISPTFIILRKYKLKKRNFFHIDLYRIQTGDDINSLGIEEIFTNKENIIAIEWAEKLEKLLPCKRIDIFFKDLGGNKRKITIKKIDFENE
ncbi:MAG: tRNA (adenosine(37)-N6)-threonylcarbamoyltransferase complex ATPase subunit type 1 TsaE [Candidatus Levyibacteriota bacterium]